MATIKTVSTAVLNEEEIKALSKAMEIFRSLDKADDDGGYFCKIENHACGCGWNYLKSIVEELLEDCDRADYY